MTLSDITLTNITRDNYEDVCDLDVTDEQQDYIATNTWSIVQSVFEPNYQARAICLNNKPVGFVMWVIEPNNTVSVWRFMIDHHFQNKGIGREAFKIILGEIKQTIKPVKIIIGYNPANLTAKKFYAKFGFAETGMDDEGEDMMAEVICQTLTAHP